MTDTSAHQVLCNKCKVALEAVPDSDPKRWSCPECHVSDTHENVLREVGEYVQEVTARHLQDKMRAAAQGSKFIQFKGDPVPQGQYRFVTDFKL